MPSLAELQAVVRRAVTAGDTVGLESVVTAGSCPPARLAIHRRHYEASLVTALRQKFPATAWLIGSDAVERAARAFVGQRPPDRPCIAEYGADFPAFLASGDVSAARAYLQAFAELEWHVGQVSIAISETPLAWPQIVSLGPEALFDCRFRLQPGVRYLRATHAIDDLMKIYLGGAAPERFTLADGEIRIEIRGARGEVQLSRLDAGACAFRAAVAAGLPLVEAIERAVMHDERFDLAHALRGLVAEGLITAVTLAPEVEA